MRWSDRTDEFPPDDGWSVDPGSGQRLIPLRSSVRLLLRSRQPLTSIGDTKRHRVRFTPQLAPLAEDLPEWFLPSGRPGGKQPVIPAHDGGFWTDDDCRNWRSRF